MSKIKICGLTRQNDIAIVNNYLPDYIGFVFAPSRRQIRVDDAKAWKTLLNPSITVVGVFVNEDMKSIIQLCDSNIIDMVQLHGDEDELYIKELKKNIPNKIIKAVRVKASEDIKRADASSCDYLLLDTYHAEQYGGSGRTFDWSMIPVIEKPYFLAGGIHINNLIQAQAMCNPYCIDVSSGVETEGYKDSDKILDIITKIRSV